MIRTRTIAVDLDGTLAVYNGDRDPFAMGDAIPKMVERVVAWQKAGHKVILFTSRLTGLSTDEAMAVKDIITEWLKRNGMNAAADAVWITNIKPPGADEFWDDRAVRVLKNTGEVDTTYKGNPAPVTVPQILVQAAETYKQRNAVYGNNYKTLGNLVQVLFAHTGGMPELKTSDDVSRLNLVIDCVAKLQRYCSSFRTGGHRDSAHDLMVYAAMLEETTNEA